MRAARYKTIDSRKLKEFLENQELLRRTYQSTECRERVKRALRGKIREHRIQQAESGYRVYYKKMGEEKWRGPGVIIGRDGKTVVVKHGGLLMSVSKIHITKIQDYGGEKSEREEAERERSWIGLEDVNEEDSENGEKVICGGNGEEEVRRDEAMHARNTHRRLRKGDRYKIKG